ncbi:MAG: DUF3795 domain-containing protein [Oscillospiraceae bacterium]|nr:DUF3795 domain-containing protein [Oscillospiraceae bacterium]
MRCSKCGLNCDECSRREEYGCPGCVNAEYGYWGGRCEIKECCSEKGVEHCGLCPDFPCELIREFSYDPETGDDGERLMTCKKWADEQRTAKEVRTKNFLLGAALGVIGGVIIGEWQGMTLPFVAVGAIVGIGIAVMVEANKK